MRLIKKGYISKLQFGEVQIMELRYFIIRRLLLLIPTLLGLVLLVFFLMRAFPDSYLVSRFINTKSSVPVSVQIANAKAALGLNYPVFVQYFFYLETLFTGNWGTMSTPIYTGSVLKGIELYFPSTIQIAIFATVLSVIIAIPLGTYIGSKPNSAADQVGRVFSLGFYAMPVFMLALLLQIIFGSGILPGNPLGVFPVAGKFSPTAIPAVPPSWFNPSTGLTSPTHLPLIDALIHGDWELAYSSLIYLALPVITVTLSLLAGILRFIRAGMVDASNQEYVKTARSKGVPEGMIIKRHVRKNALIPTVTILGLLFASLLGGVIVVEEVFNYIGMGVLTINAVQSISIYGVLGTTFVFGVTLMAANLIVDIAYAFIDPRIRY